MDGGRGLANTRAAVERALREAGFRLRPSIAGDGDVVIVPFGLVSSFVVYTAAGREDDAARAMTRAKGVDLCVTRTADGFRVEAERGSALIHRHPTDPPRWRYEWSGEDPLWLSPELHADFADGGSHGRRRVVRRAPSTISIPIRSIASRRASSQVENPASVVCSVARGYMYGAKITAAGLAGLGGAPEVDPRRARARRQPGVPDVGRSELAPTWPGALRSRAGAVHRAVGRPRAAGRGRCERSRGCEPMTASMIVEHEQGGPMSRARRSLSAVMPALIAGSLLGADPGWSQERSSSSPPPLPPPALTDAPAPLDAPAAAGDTAERSEGQRRRSRRAEFETTTLTLGGDRTIEVRFDQPTTEDAAYRAIQSPIDGQVVAFIKNRPLKLKTPVDLRFGDVVVRAHNQGPDYPGVYSLWLKSVAGQWRLVFNHLPTSGARSTTRRRTRPRCRSQVAASTAPVESFTATLEPAGAAGSSACGGERPSGRRRSPPSRRPRQGNGAPAVRRPASKRDPY